MGMPCLKKIMVLEAGLTKHNKELWLR